MKALELIPILEAQAAEIASSDLSGWGNTMILAAAELRRLAAVEADRAQRVLDADGDSLTIAYLHGFAKGKDAALTASTAHPSPAQQPLTDEQIKHIHWSKPMDEFQFARAIEQAHGIGVKND